MDLLSPKEKQILDSQREIDWLKRKIKKYEKELEPPPEINVTLAAAELHEPTKESYKDTIDELREKLDIMTQFNVSKECLTSAIDASHHVLKSLYPGEIDHDSFKRSQAVKIMIRERDELTSLFLNGLEQLRKTKNEIAQTQAKAVERLQENRELVQSIREVKEQLVQELEVPSGTGLLGSQTAEPSERIDDYRTRLEIARNVLRNLILESGIDYLYDDHWYQVMAEIGDELKD
ncbi:hypothetical protein BJV82DRAFT_717078 [Fennellomyces sp. T-0311]|nr:hypothetical protein BJV82DRAFT_717078 [Fennellomyces sp. T-0311]